jgi:hypothetical protein
LSLVISLPDEAARQQTSLIHVWALEASEPTATCTSLVDGSARPGAGGTTVEAELEFAYPVQGGLEPLRNVGPGPRLFYAEGLDSTRRRLLAGCTEQTAGGGGPGQVTIALAWVEDCEPTHGGVETCDGVDNDCDGSTDEGLPADLCPARDRATATACRAGACEYACEAGWFNADGRWDNGCECTPTLGGVEWCDGVDNDCDGTVDGPGCQRCTADADCAAAAGPCLRAACNIGTGVCETTPLGVGEACDDGNPCTQTDRCDAQGACAGTPRACSDGIDCTDDACDPADGQCKYVLRDGFCLMGVSCVLEGALERPDGCMVCDPTLDPLAYSRRPEVCDDSLFCNGQEDCDAGGLCFSEPSPCQQACLMNCDEDLDECVPDPEDTPCEDGAGCTRDACDGAGRCVSVPDDALCIPGGVSRCAPECSSDPSGCLDAYPALVLDCPVDPPADREAHCKVQTVPDPRAALCAECWVDGQYPVWLAEGLAWVDPFDGQCKLNGWELLDRVCSGSAATCPLPTGTNTCCTQLECSSYPPTAQPAIRLVGSGCASQGVAFGRELDLRAYAGAFVCLDLEPYNRRELDWAVQLEAVDLRHGTRLVGDCAGNTCGRFEDTAFDYCLQVPAEALQWERTRLLVQAHPGQTSYELYLRGIRVLGMPRTCPEPTRLFETVFWNCSGQQISRYEDWQIPSGVWCASHMLPTCLGESGLVVGSEPMFPVSRYLDMFTQVDLSAFDHGARLCWLRFFPPGFGTRPMGMMEIWANSPVGQSVIYRESFGPYNRVGACEVMCVNLDSRGVKHTGQPAVQIEVHANVDDLLLVLDSFLLVATGRCQADGAVELGPVAAPDAEPGDYLLPVSSLSGTPAHPVVRCAFQGLVWSEDDLRFVLP